MKNFTQAMRAGSARDLPAFVPGAGSGGPVIEGFFGECICGALIITDGGVEWDWRFGVYLRTRHHCQTQLVKEVRQLAQQSATPARAVALPKPTPQSAIDL